MLSGRNSVNCEYTNVTILITIVIAIVYMTMTECKRDFLEVFFGFLNLNSPARHTINRRVSIIVL